MDAPAAAGQQGEPSASAAAVAEVLRLKDALRRLQAAHLSEKQASAAALQTAGDEHTRLQVAEAEVLRLETRVLELEEEAQELAQVRDFCHLRHESCCMFGHRLIDGNF